jgi:hypothetical protein
MRHCPRDYQSDRVTQTARISSRMAKGKPRKRREGIPVVRESLEQPAHDAFSGLKLDC